jgi:glycine oxidase
MTVGIVGAGLLGQLIAWQLILQGYDVTIFSDSDKTAKGSATFAAAGMLTPLVELEKAEMLIRNLGAASLILWKELISSLTNDVFHQFNGSIVTAHPEDLSELTRFKQAVTLKSQEVSLTHPASNLLVDSNIIATNAYYFPDDGQIDSHSLLAALNAELLAVGVTWYAHVFVDGIFPKKIHCNGKVFHFDLVVDCRGYRAKSAFSDLRGVRGELLKLYAPAVNLSCPVRLLTPRYPIYIVPLNEGGYLLGASEIESEDLSSISVRSTLELLSAAYSLHSGFAEARIIESRVGLRPALLNNLPQIKVTEGEIAINGLYRHGFLTAPAIINDLILYLKGGINNTKFPQLFNEGNHD